MTDIIRKLNFGGYLTIESENFGVNKMEVLNFDRFQRSLVYVLLPIEEFFRQILFSFWNLSFKSLLLTCPSPHRECVSTGAAGAQTRRSLGHHLLHPLILRLLVLCAPVDFEAQSSLL